MNNIKEINKRFLDKVFYKARNYELNNNNIKIFDKKIFGIISNKNQLSLEKSFITNINKLGGQVITYYYEEIRNKDFFIDTIHYFCDFLLIDNNFNVNMTQFLKNCKIPSINIGYDNIGHPIQSLFDFYIMDYYYKIYTFKNVNKILIIGDINQNNIKSLIYLIFKFTDALINIINTNSNQDTLRNWIIKFPMFKNNDLYKLSSINYINNTEYIDYDIIYITKFDENENKSLDLMNFYINDDFFRKINRNAIIINSLIDLPEINNIILNDYRCINEDYKKKSNAILKSIINYLLFTI